MALVTHLSGDLHFASHFREQAGFRDGVREGFLHVNVLAHLLAM